MNATVFAPRSMEASGAVTLLTWRLYDRVGAAWRVMVTDFNARACVSRGATLFPMASAVVDDFGTLVLVGAWS